MDGVIEPPEPTEEEYEAWCKDRERLQNQTDVFAAIIKERAEQDKKWATQNHPAPIWLAILTEEVGEVAEIVIEANFDGDPFYGELEHELTQIAAVAVAWLERIKRNRDQPKAPKVGDTLIITDRAAVLEIVPIQNIYNGCVQYAAEEWKIETLMWDPGYKGWFADRKHARQRRFT